MAEHSTGNTIIDFKKNYELTEPVIPFINCGVRVWRIDCARD